MKSSEPYRTLILCTSQKSMKLLQECYIAFEMGSKSLFLKSVTRMIHIQEVPASNLDSVSV